MQDWEYARWLRRREDELQGMQYWFDGNDTHHLWGEEWRRERKGEVFGVWRRGRKGEIFRSSG
jgi:hypothetical protein